MIKDNGKPKIAVIIPCYNEEEVLPETINILSDFLERMKASEISEDSFLLFIDDGSKDNTWHTIEKAAQISHFIKAIKFSRNFGHQNALLAGYEYVVDKCDAALTIDADLQDDINVVEEGIKKINDGCDIVYFARKRRSADSWFKRTTAVLFYKLMALLGVEIVYNHADFRLTTNRVQRELLSFREVNLFLRAMFPLMGFRSEIIYEDRKERKAGESKYPLKKMLAFAFEGITSFSVMPLRFITVLGIIVFLLSILMGFYIVFVKFFGHSVVPGWASVVIPIYLLGGLTIFSIGVAGEYIGKIYKEVKARPRFIVDKVIE
ncbi:Glycosyltransferase [Desulfurella amilsii]|uniref:Glycosyltransferase n=1 Tax=Desulfurella amilsii TaxID=1562698 RepID=A0A1X4XY02_9BACT|nr:glycosyltransferase family 2 protein [Desulfurella amilsii]OSS42405.1 Glycosyltransferase [Desulfurella amilsii]